MKHSKSASVVLLLIVAGALAFYATHKRAGPAVHEKPGGVKARTEPLMNFRLQGGSGEPPPEVSSMGPPHLNVSALPVDKNGPVFPGQAVKTEPRRRHTDDDILTLGGVLPTAGKVPAVNQDARVKSINAKDWNGSANLLVNALRVGNSVELNHDELMDFLQGRDLFGWPEDLRNWIGDELMTVLRQDTPQSAFAYLKEIEANPSAPAAMRDYSVQHIGHLITSGVVGQDGVDFLWDVLAKNDPNTLGTALVSLHRVSEQTSNLVTADQVNKTADRLRKSSDERTRSTSDAILKK